MANPEHVEILRKGVEHWNGWRKKNPEIEPELSEANLRELELSGANLSNADLSKENLRYGRLSGADLSGSILSGTNLQAADLSEADLSKSDLSKSDLSGANLSRADLRWAYLRNADLSQANLEQANVSGAYLIGAQLSWANLSKANLRDTDLTSADLSRADLSGADLSGTDLTAASLTGANISGANFNSSRIIDTIFASVDLSDVKGLDEVEHYGPSEISMSTIYLSKGKIPVSFLRGAGVPDMFIEYMHTLVATAFKFYSCFISYSSKDQAFAERLHADLQNQGVRCWFAPHDAKSGQKLHEQIDQAIRLHEKLLLILSPESTKSEWVKEEIRNAAHRQKREKKKVLFPVSLMPYEKLRRWKFWDNDLKKDLASEIREYVIPDFSTWENNRSYQKEFAKLLQDLKSRKSKHGAFKKAQTLQTGN